MRERIGRGDRYLKLQGLIKDALEYGGTGHVNVLVHVNVNDTEQRLDMP